jgi:isopentenyldiphosphate isomerase
MEYWDIYNKDGNKTNRIIQKGFPFKKDDFHLAVEAWIINSDLKILIQQRSRQCAILPGIWALTTGRVISSEDSKTACIREISEELGIHILENEIYFIKRIIRNDGLNLIWDIYMVTKNIDYADFKLQQNEVERIKWVSIDEYISMLDSGKAYRYPEIFDIMTLMQTKWMELYNK